MLFHPKMEVGFEPTRLSCCSTKLNYPDCSGAGVEPATYNELPCSTLELPLSREGFEPSTLATFSHSPLLISILSPIGNNTILLYRNRRLGRKSKNESLFILLLKRSTYLKSILLVFIKERLSLLTLQRSLC